MDSIPYFGVSVCLYVFFYAVVRFLLCARGKPEKSYPLRVRSGCKIDCSIVCFEVALFARFHLQTSKKYFFGNNYTNMKYFICDFL